MQVEKESLQWDELNLRQKARYEILAIKAADRSKTISEARKELDSIIGPDDLLA